MAGVELAGLFLAVVPLVLSGIEESSEIRFSALKYTKLYGPLAVSYTHLTLPTKA